MISTNQFKNGMSIVIDDKIFEIIEFQHVKPGKGGAFVRTKLKNIDSGAVIDKTFRAGEKFKTAHLQKKPMQYLYNDGSNYYFMDNTTYEQLPLSSEMVKDAKSFITEGMNVDIVFHNNNPISIKAPTFVELKVTKAEPGMKGDTAASGTKPVQLETGITVQAPLFINVGDVLKIDTRSGEYVERV